MGALLAITRLNALVRILTAHLGALGRLGARYLQRTAGQRFFPDLWEVRTRLYAAPLPAGFGS
jgi:tryptophan 2,3-dioxygenase